MLEGKDEVVAFVQTLVNEEWLDNDEELTDALLCWEDGFANFAMVLHDIGDGDEDEIAIVFDKVADSINAEYRDWIVHEASRPTRWMGAKARELADD